MAGAEPTEEAFAEAARLAAAVAEPITGRPGERRVQAAVAEVYVRRGLARALELAPGEGQPA